MTQRQVADLLGAHYQVFQRWEKGERIPTADIAIRIAQALNTTVEELFVLEDGDWVSC